MAIEEHVLANILSASIKTISDKEYGSMLLEVANDDELQRFLRYLSTMPDIIAEEVS